MALTREREGMETVYALALVSTSLGTATMNTVFYFYYVKIFLHHYHVSASWFYICQTVFLVWNAINDPLFGYFQETCRVNCCRIRRLTILYGSIWYSLSFLIPWFPWTSTENNSDEWITGLHLLVSLCFFDSLYTYVLLAWCSYFTEMSSNFHERVTLLWYCQAAWLLSRSGVMICEYFSSNLQDFHAFQNVCICISIFGFGCMVFTGIYGKPCKNKEYHGSEPHEERNMWNLVQLMKQKNFLRFVLTNLLQTIHITCDESFFRVYSERLIFHGAVNETFTKTIFYGSLPVLPTMIAIVLSPVVRKHGVYHLVMASFVVKCLLGIIMYCIGKNYPTVNAVYFLLDICLVGCPWSWFSLTLSDLIDDDKKTYNRVAPISSMAYGMNALITKPGHSIAPMLVVGVLSKYGYEHLSVPSIKPTSPSEVGNNELLTDAMFNLACGVPVIIGVLQIVIFLPYNLKETHHKEKDNGFDVHELLM